MNVVLSIPLIAGLVISAIQPASFLQSTSDYLISPESANYFFTPNLTPVLPPVYFCGESVPLHEEAVARRLVSALVTNTHKNQALYRIRQRAATFFPIIEPILARHRIPSDFKYLPLVESALTGFAVSSRGAVGYWQFMPETARELGLTIIYASL